MQWIQVRVVVFFSAIVVTWQEKCKDDNVCTQMKTHGMWSADCYKREFRKFPQCLRSDVEVIDLSYNRLRQITKDDLYRYSSIKILYLSDNTLTNLKNTTFKGLDKLISLDLSLNGITKLPHQVFHLPSLKRLYLSQNQNINMVEVVKEAVPITSPLEAIDISFNDLETLPNFGMMPYLWLYNISGNNLLNMDMKNFIGLCNLKILANTNFTSLFHKPCDCWNIQRWLTYKMVNFTNIECDVKEQDCPYIVSQEYTELYNECKTLSSKLEWESTFPKVIIIVSVLLVLIILAVLGFFYYRRKKQVKTNKLREELKLYAEKVEKDKEGLL